MKKVRCLDGCIGGKEWKENPLKNSFSEVKKKKGERKEKR